MSPAARGLAWQSAKARFTDKRGGEGREWRERGRHAGKRWRGCSARRLFSRKLPFLAACRQRACFAAKLNFTTTKRVTRQSPVEPACSLLTIPCHSQCAQKRRPHTSPRGSDGPSNQPPCLTSSHSQRRPINCPHARYPGQIPRKRPASPCGPDLILSRPETFLVFASQSSFAGVCEKGRMWGMAIRLVTLKWLLLSAFDGNSRKTSFRMTSNVTSELSFMFTTIVFIEWKITRISHKERRERNTRRSC